MCLQQNHIICLSYSFFFFFFFWQYRMVSYLLNHRLNPAPATKALSHTYHINAREFPTFCID